MEILVKVDEIKEAGLELKREIPAAALDSALRAEPPTGFTTQTPAELVARLSRVGEDDIVVQARMRVDATCDCRRCLDPVAVSVPVDFTAGLVREGKLPGQAAEGEDDGEGPLSASFDPADADLIPYTGKQVDLWPAVREQLLLALPMHAVCKEDCQGLCQVCGRNLNDEGACTCDRSVPDPRWAALRNLKLD